MSDRGVLDALEGLRSKLELAERVLTDVGDKEVAAKWDRKFINSLPDAAFAVIEKGYPSKSSDKNARMLPHHNKNVKSPTENSSVDLPHLRNAMARAPLIKSAIGTESDGALRKKAAAHLAKHRAVLKGSNASFSAVDTLLWKECEELYEKNILPLLEDE